VTPANVPFLWQHHYSSYRARAHALCCSSHHRQQLPLMRQQRQQQMYPVSSTPVRIAGVTMSVGSAHVEISFLGRVSAITLSTWSSSELSC
jgi:hypothetical protein